MALFALNWWQGRNGNTRHHQTSFGMRRVTESIVGRWDFNLPWYHGSPLQLKRLRAGSTITQDRDLARVFSHKPSLVSQGTPADRAANPDEGVLHRQDYIQTNPSGESQGKTRKWPQ